MLYNQNLLWKGRGKIRKSVINLCFLLILSTWLWLIKVLCMYHNFSKCPICKYSHMHAYIPMHRDTQRLASFGQIIYTTQVQGRDGKCWMQLKFNPIHLVGIYYHRYSEYINEFEVHKSWDSFSSDMWVPYLVFVSLSRLITIYNPTIQIM